MQLFLNDTVLFLDDNIQGVKDIVGGLEFLLLPFQLWSCCGREREAGPETGCIVQSKVKGLSSNKEKMDAGCGVS